MKVVVTALLCLIAAVTLAPARRAQDAGAAPAAPPPNPTLTPTRLAVIDSKALAGEGVRLEKGGAALADLRAFGEALKVEIIDVEKLTGAVFVADGRLDITDAFLAARKSRRSKTEPLDVSNVNVPSTAVAFIDTEAFGDQQKGITRLVRAFKSIDAEFKPRKDEITKLRERLDAGSGDRKRLEDEIRRKQEAGQKELNRRVTELTGPVYRDIGNSLTPFCKKRGISLLFDVSKMKKTDGLAPFDVSLPPDTPDVTAAFVSAYNRGVIHNYLVP